MKKVQEFLIRLVLGVFVAALLLAGLWLLGMEVTRDDVVVENVIGLGLGLLVGTLFFTLRK